MALSFWSRMSIMQEQAAGRAVKEKKRARIPVQSRPGDSRKVAELAQFIFRRRFSSLFTRIE